MIMVMFPWNPKKPSKHVKCSFDNHAENFSMKVRKKSRRFPEKVLPNKHKAVLKNMPKNFRSKSEKKSWSKKIPKSCPGQLKWSFAKTAKQFPLTIGRILLKSSAKLIKIPMFFKKFFPVRFLNIYNLKFWFCWKLRLNLFITTGINSLFRVSADTLLLAEDFSKKIITVFLCSRILAGRKGQDCWMTKDFGFQNRNNLKQPASFLAARFQLIILHLTQPSTIHRTTDFDLCISILIAQKRKNAPLKP